MTINTNDPDVIRKQLADAMDKEKGDTGFEEVDFDNLPNQADVDKLFANLNKVSKGVEESIDLEPKAEDGEEEPQEEGSESEDEDLEDDFYEGDADEDAPPLDEKQDEPKKKSRAQERILQLNEQKKQALAEKQAAEAERNQYKRQALEAQFVAQDHVEKLSDSQIASYKAQLRAAQEGGDFETTVELLQKLQEATLAKSQAAARKAELSAEYKVLTEPAKQETQSQGEVPDAYLEWAAKNDSWYSMKQDNAKSILAHRIADKMIEAGDDWSKPGFYTRLDAKLKAVQGSKQTQSKPKTNPTIAKKAPVTVRNTGVGNGNKGGLDSIDESDPRVAFAKQMGIDPKVYIKNFNDYNKGK